MEPKRRSHPGLLLLLGILAISLVLVYFSVRSLEESRSYAAHQAEIHTRNLAQALDSSISESIHRIDQALLTVTSELEVNLASGRLDPRRMQQFLATQEKLLPEVVALRVTNAEGTVIINNPSGDPLADFRDRPFWLPLRDHPSPGVFISKPIIGKFTGKWVMPIARRYNLPDGRFAGVVVAPHLVEHLQQDMKGFELGTGGMLTLRDSDGGFVARQPEVVKGKTLTVGQKEFSNELRTILASGVRQQTYLATAPFDETRRTLTFRRLRTVPLFIVASLAEEDYLAQWRSDRQKMLARLAAALLGFWILAGLLWHLMTIHERTLNTMLVEREAATTILNRMSELARIGGWELDLATMKLTWSLGTYELHELDPQAVVDIDSAIHFYAPEAQPIISKAVNTAIETGVPFDLELPLLTAKGRRFLARAQGSVLMQNGKAIKLVGAFQDITSRKRTEDELRASKRQFENLVARIPIGVYLIRSKPDESIAFEFISPRMAEIFGLDLEALKSDILLAFQKVHPDDLEAFVQLNKIGLRDTVPFKWTGRIIRDGAIRWLHIESAPERLDDGDVFWHGVVNDVTDRMVAEEDKAKLRAQFQQSQKMESLGVLAGGVAHDMNNVLGAILGLASAHIESQAMGSATQRAFETIIKAAERGGKMVRALLSFARQGPAESRLLNMNELLQEEVHLLERTTLSKVRLVTDFAVNLRPIMGDASALTHAFMNLCVNAVEAMPENGTLTLRTHNVDHDWIEVVVEDTGTGMSKEVMERAVDPFYTTKGVGKGTGLGLSTVYSTVKAHNGQMDIKSEPGHGTRVMMRLPACEVMASAEEPPTQFEAQVPHKALTVLAVDDDELIQYSIRVLLQTMGHTVAIVSTGEEALAKLESGWVPDVVILDMNMPGLGGAGTLPRIRTLHPTTPVLLATGRVDQFALDLIQAHPNVHLLSKPFNKEDLQRYLNVLGLG